MASTGEARLGFTAETFDAKPRRRKENPEINNFNDHYSYVFLCGFATLRHDFWGQRASALSS
jgi:hypothetical protein